MTSLSVNKWYVIDSNRAVILLMLDLSAAFDTVSHEILLDGPVTTSWYYWVCTRMVRVLSSRTKFVQIDGSKSSLRELNCGVPQGSVLGA